MILNFKPTIATIEFLQNSQGLKYFVYIFEGQRFKKALFKPQKITRKFCDSFKIY